MKKIIRLTESDLVKIVKRVLTEGTTGKIEGRDFIVNSDYTVSISDSKGVKKKIKFSALSSKINIKDITKSGPNYIITSKNGTKKTVESDKIKKIINFVDSTKTETEISTGMLTPDLVLNKV